MNHSWNYYRKLYAHPGKTVFYALRKVKPKQHDAIIAIHAIYREIYAILFKCHEPSVARIRLQWWRDEISKLYAGNAQHVVCQTLHPHLIEYSLNKHLFFDLILFLFNFKKFIISNQSTNYWNSRIYGFLFLTHVLSIFKYTQKSKT